VAKPYFPFVKLPSFSGDSDPNVYLGWEAKVEQTFHVHEVLEAQRVRLASLEFLDYAMQWWHKTLVDIGLNKRPPVVSWNILKECMWARFVPPPSRKEHFVEPSGVQALKNPNPLKDVEALAELAVAVLF